MQEFDIYFRGQLIEGWDRDRVRMGIGKIFKVKDTALDHLFSGKPFRIKKNVDVEMANRFRATFRDIGALIDITPAGERPASLKKPGDTVSPIAKKTPDTETAGWQLSPPKTGSLEDCAVAFETPEYPEIGHIALSSPGIDLDDTPPASTRDIDISRLSVAPANTGSLEDCVTEKPARVIPDISHMDITEDN